VSQPIALERIQTSFEPAASQCVWCFVPSVTKSVLIVDDNAFACEALCKLFQQDTGFEVCGRAENGKEAIKKARELRPDLIVLDFSMPVMNGFEAARVLRRLMPTVPLIMYSGFEDRFAKYQAQLIGITDVVSKSEPASVLLRKARNLFDRAAS
jgi:two-component system, chemotaxis family, protein-glutamate methylesterase/glutaminase